MWPGEKGRPETSARPRQFGVPASEISERLRSLGWIELFHPLHALAFNCVPPQGQRSRRERSASGSGIAGFPEGAVRSAHADNLRVHGRQLCGRGDRKGHGDVMFMTLCIVLFVAWLLGWGAFHVAGGLIHFLLILAVISLIVHFVRGRGATI
jgi:Family of unknown function (DUF5670)